MYYSHGFIITVVNESPRIALLTLFLKLEVFLKDRGKAVPLQQAYLLNQVWPITGNIFQVYDHRHIVTLWGMREKQDIKYENCFLIEYNERHKKSLIYYQFDFSQLNIILQLFFMCTSVTIKIKIFGSHMVSWIENKYKQVISHLTLAK